MTTTMPPQTQTRRRPYGPDRLDDTQKETVRRYLAQYNEIAYPDDPEGGQGRRKAILGREKEIQVEEAFPAAGDETLQVDAGHGRL